MIDEVRDETALLPYETGEPRAHPTLRLSRRFRSHRREGCHRPHACGGRNQSGELRWPQAVELLNSGFQEQLSKTGQ